MKRSRPPGSFFAATGTIFVLLAVAVFTQVRAQVLERGEVMERAKSVWMIARSGNRELERGSIVSSDGRVLAQSDSKFDFWVFYDRVPCTPGFFMDLAEAAGISETRLSAPFSKGQKRVWLEPLDSKSSVKVREVKRKWGADGVSLEEQRSRIYPLGAAAVNLVGWSRDGKPLSGIELSLDDALSGRNGSLNQYRGADVVTTIDSQLQNLASIAIQNAVKKHGATSGSAIVMVPKTGAILAMADWPSFDPITGPTGGSERAVSYMEDLQPGSTFKVLTLAKALDVGAVSATAHLDCKGVLDLGRGRTVKCDLHNGKRAHGPTDLEHAIGLSCNISATTWALKVGRDEMLGYIEEIGLLSKPELGIKGAVTPLFDPNEYDKERQLATLGFGQSIAVPPVSLAAAVNVIANDGSYVPPRLIEMRGAYREPMAPTRRVLSVETARKVRSVMESVVHEEWGTGSTLAIPGIRIAGKTGTAQKLGPDGGNVSSFVGMFPSQDPQVLILVMVNDPKAGEFYGSLVAGPVFKEIAYAAIERLKIARGETVSTTGSDAASPGA